MIKIDKGLKIPPPAVGRPRKYPFPDMEVGDSFFSEDVENVSAAVGKYNKRQPETHFVRRRVDGGIRIWRTK